MSRDRDATGDPSADSSHSITVRSSDLPLLYTLLILHVAVMLSLPVAGWFIVRFLNAWPDHPAWLVPGLIAVLVLVEVGLAFRLRSIGRRVRGVSR